MTYVRGIHCLIAQIQVFLSSRRSESLSKGIIDVSEGTIDYYHTRMISLMNTAGEAGRYRPSSKFGGALMILRAWLHSALQAGSSRSRQAIIAPLGSGVSDAVHRMSLSADPSSIGSGMTPPSTTAQGSSYQSSISREPSADTTATSPNNPNSNDSNPSASPSNFGGNLPMDDFPMEMELMGVDANLLAHLEDVGAIDMDMGNWSFGPDLSNIGTNMGGVAPAPGPGPGPDPMAGGGATAVRPGVGEHPMLPGMGQTMNPWPSQF